MEAKRYYSNGKFLITGEYLVLKGAHALSVPLIFGQELNISNTGKPGEICWKTYIKEKKWFETRYRTHDLKILETTDFDLAENLKVILSAARKLRSKFLTTKHPVSAHSRLNFDINWGLGSSSTLISNIAYWADADPFDLHFMVSNGSGYDIASARSDFPLIYQLDEMKPSWTNVNFNPGFKDKIYFVYSGKKQFSDKSVRGFLTEENTASHDVDAINRLTHGIIKVSDIVDFEKLIAEHEKLISKVIRKKRIKELHFNDFKGEIKSLGAWGGDFIMVTWKYEKENLIKYFSDKNLKTIFSFDEIILQSEI